MASFKKVNQTKKDTGDSKKKRRELIASGRAKVLTHVVPAVFIFFALLVVVLKYLTSK